MDLFNSPKFLIRQTRDNVAEFTRICDAFFKAHPGRSVVETNPKTGEETHKFCFGEPFPDRLREIAFNGIMNMRLALDQAACKAFEAITKRDAPDSLYFPIATNAADLKGRVKQHFPPELHATFEGFKSYPTGNDTPGDIVCDMNKAARRKHRIVCGISAQVESWSFNETLVIPAGTRFPILEWDARNDELIIAVVPRNGRFHAKFDISFFVCFNDAGPLTTAPVIGALGPIADAVEKIVLDIERDTLAILASRS